MVIKMVEIAVEYWRRRSTRFWSGSPFSPLGWAESEGRVGPSYVGLLLWGTEGEKDLWCKNYW